MKGDLKFSVFAAVPSDIGRKLGAFGAFLAWSPALAPVGGAGLGFARAADAAQGGGGRRDNRKITVTRCNNPGASFPFVNPDLDSDPLSVFG